MNRDTNKDKQSNMPPITPEMLEMFQRIVLSKLNAFIALNKRVTPGGIVFVGDSITEGYPVYEMLPSLVTDSSVVYNRGIGGIPSQYILDHMDELLLNLAPSKLFLQVGTNDLFMGTPVDTIAENIVKICAITREHLPKTRIFVISLYPVDEAFPPKYSTVGSRTNANLTLINAALVEKLKQYPKITYINAYPALLDSEGNLADDNTHDGLHLAMPGYEILTGLIKEYL
ncbi:1-alkyl-2-acetylglycerophosphocholine esterase [Clostridia bacterium]|nr:1-alkyl-2-acetylglycerophosphocholine esterase [Clostridia bacterium]